MKGVFYFGMRNSEFAKRRQAGNDFKISRKVREVREVFKNQASRLAIGLKGGNGVCEANGITH